MCWRQLSMPCNCTRGQFLQNAHRLPTFAAELTGVANETDRGRRPHYALARLARCAEQRSRRAAVGQEQPVGPFEQTAGKRTFVHHKAKPHEPIRSACYPNRRAAQDRGTSVARESATWENLLEVPSSWSLRPFPRVPDHERCKGDLYDTVENEETPAPHGVEDDDGIRRPEDNINPSSHGRR